jgi:hypothetical protein
MINIGGMEQWSAQKTFANILCQLNEKQQRLYVASEALRIGYGGITKVSFESGVSRVTISKGVHELQKGVVNDGRIRAIGGGRKSTEKKQEGILEAICKIANPKGDPESPLLWTTLSAQHISHELKRQGFKAGATTTLRILKSLGFALKSNKKNIEGNGTHEDRDAQFRNIENTAKEAISRNNPVISIDCKKKELIGNFKNNGREWVSKDKNVEVNVYDFPSLSNGKIAPYGIYDMVHNTGFVNVGVNHDTAEFSVESIRRWWMNYGRNEYIEATGIMITADGGGSNGSRNRMFKIELQKLSNEIKIPITVCHYPPYTSKWNAIEHKLFSFISINWRARPLISLEIVLEILNNTTTKTGLKVTAMLDTNEYKTGIKISNEEINSLNIHKDEFHESVKYFV